MKKPKAFLFDMDGTLCHTEPLHLAAVRRVLDEHGRTLDKHVFETELAGQTTQVVFAKLFPELPASARDRLIERKEALFRQFANNLEPAPGVVDFTDGIIAEGALVALVTNAPRKDIDHILGVLRMEDRFPIKIVASELPRPKPDPMAYVEALRACRATAEEAVVFEDSVTGIASARAAGIDTIGVTSTLSRSELLGAGAFATIADFRDSSLRTLVSRAA